MCGYDGVPPNLQHVNSVSLKCSGIETFEANAKDADAIAITVPLNSTQNKNLLTCTAPSLCTSKNLNCNSYCQKHSIFQLTISRVSFGFGISVVTSSSQTGFRVFFLMLVTNRLRPPTFTSQNGSLNPKQHAREVSTCIPAR